MSLTVLTRQGSAAGPVMAALRDRAFQQDPDRFRANLRRMGVFTAYEVSKKLAYATGTVETPLGAAEASRLAQQPVLACLLRAGLPFYDGFLDVFPYAESAFLGTYRGPHQADHTFEVVTEYRASPRIDGKTLILCDPMLATGKSLVKNYEALLRFGQPAEVHIACVIAAEAGIEHVAKELPQAHIWVGAVDADLNENFYIVPGLGDAGDLAFGMKL